ncbi:MAG: hypothetical protein ACRYGI_12905 [Janthinobacterium lividum]
MARQTKPTPSRAGKAAPKSTNSVNQPTASRAKQVAASPSKDELRARVEKLERANTILRAKNRTGLSNFHQASDRVVELEAHVEKLELQLSRSSTDVKAKPAAEATKPKRTAGRRPRAVNGTDETDKTVSINETGVHADMDDQTSARIQ